MLTISNRISIPLNEIEFKAIRAQGCGGQNVNKVSSAIHLRFDIKRSSLPDFFKDRLLAYQDQRITVDGVIVIKAQSFRDQERNKEDSLLRLRQLIKTATTLEKQRRATKPTRSSQRKRMDKKNKRGQIKKGRGKVDF
ncbi:MULTISPECIES: alternative ribosome rescue aminoacyl-tRNA hydrolase ArfB [unclassified Neptuniibacter]|jgi:ribosome-associated protein|uniref:alternative ribosome rescue aminoacyl-tRNA hydrolase ArfB n=1 Tax=unclassified Neptuniibacter TaxID=2630693 RepID=UPI0026E2FEAC|nr:MULTISPECIES: alternative ribosome rescue aminoacyl-tRNA hydrolase ArfB [unclassified Neptuniibacter]MDO6513109.1 alternative ribosome rescue aminoacyl-tRNA hydrolase ArfB [Neptuniibacter sp. 2_MG-2023]MDO6592479.1 alternative ribosome rescue aminoacyl-tRNA hydrolase ArfB [Neptuniibacter sp. 1_MG-2023]